MGKVHLREHGSPSPNGHGPLDASVNLKPLAISGVVVTKAALIEALRVYVPALADLHVTEDGERFWLVLGQSAVESPSN